MTIPQHGITADRKTPDKIKFIVDNRDKMTRKELCAHLGESPRWLKRQLALLLGSGQIKQKQFRPEKVFLESDWTPPVKARITELRRNFLKSNKDICTILQKEFDVVLCPGALQFWMGKFNILSRTKQEWLEEFLPKDLVEELLNQNYRMVDISRHLKEKYGVYISDDLILVHVQKLGMLSQKLKKIQDIQSHADTFSKELLESKINSHAGLRGLSEFMGVSKTVVMKKLNREKLKLIPHRILWSQDLDILRDLLLKVDLIALPDELFHQMILGWLLGDGHLDSHGRFIIGHSLIQLDYFYLKCRVLKKYLTNVTTRTTNFFVIEGIPHDAKESLVLSCPGLNDYLKYLKKDGSKDLEKILSELNPLGLACYYMDDGSHDAAHPIIAMRKEWVKVCCQHPFFGGPSGPHTVKVKEICPDFIIPGMSYKVRESSVGSFWKTYLPELFDVKVLDVLSLGFVNQYVCEKTPSIIFDAVAYYHKRGFPQIVLSDEYLKEEYKRLIKLESRNLWKKEDLLRPISLGSPIFKNFMGHMNEARYRGVSPKETFDNSMSLSKVLQYTLKQIKSILPQYVHNNLMFFNGGVSGFPCSVAKALVERFSNKGDIIVDPCAGWGGRLLGTSSAERFYVGFEPWEKTALQLKKMIEFFNIQGIIHNENFNPDHAPEQSHLILTSPPYYDLEIYGRPFKKDDWDDLINKIFKYAEKALTDQGHLVLNLPPSMEVFLPSTSLIKYPSLYWQISPRKKDLEVLHIWTKQPSLSHV